jgi:hypothetical protein
MAVNTPKGDSTKDIELGKDEEGNYIMQIKQF